MVKRFRYIILAIVGVAVPFCAAAQDFDFPTTASVTLKGRGRVSIERKNGLLTTDLTKVEADLRLFATLDDLAVSMASDAGAVVVSVKMADMNSVRYWLSGMNNLGLKFPAKAFPQEAACVAPGFAVAKLASALRENRGSLSVESPASDGTRVVRIAASTDGTVIAGGEEFVVRGNRILSNRLSVDFGSGPYVVLEQTFDDFTQEGYPRSLRSTIYDLTKPGVVTAQMTATYSELTVSSGSEESDGFIASVTRNHHRVEPGICVRPSTSASLLLEF